MKPNLLIQKSPLKYTAEEHLVKASPVFQFAPTPIKTLWLLLQKIPDPRRPQGTRHPLAIVLLLAILAICCGESSYEAMKDWASNYQETLVSDLPFLAGHTPAKSTFHRIFSVLQAEDLEKLFGTWLQAVTPLAKHEGIAIDGKAVKNTDLYVVSAFAHQAKTVLFQQATSGKGKELVAAPEVLERLDFTNKVITGDALFTQRKLCRLITAGGGGYVFTVKNNQRTVRETIQSYFIDPIWQTAYGRTICDITEKTTLDVQKGRVEERIYQVTNNADLLTDINWPGLTHVWRVHRVVTHKRTGQTHTETAYGIARFLTSARVVDQLADRVRGHWQIENNLHRKRDVVWNEDKSAVKTKNGPQVMSALTNLVISIFHRGMVTSFPAANRRFRAQPKELFAFLGLYQQHGRAFQQV